MAQAGHTRSSNRTPWIVLIGWWLLSAIALPQGTEPTNRAPDLEPLVERYILDELKALRQEQLTALTTVHQEFAELKASTVDRMVNYASSVVNVVFFVITGGATLLAVLGWNSLRDVGKRIDKVVDEKVEQASADYERRIGELEARLKKRGEDIVAAHEEIAKTNAVHALWLRAGLETNPRNRIHIYDEILGFNRRDVEALAYQADAVLELKEPHWALNLCNMALSFDDAYANGYWQRACAYALLGQTEPAIADLRRAVELSPRLMEDVASEPAFESIRHTEDFVQSLETPAS